MISGSPQAGQAQFLRNTESAFGQDASEASYTPDMAAECDSESDELAEEFFWFVKNNIPVSKMQVDWLVMKEVISCAGRWGITVQERERKNMAGLAWEMLGRVIGLLLGAKNLAVQVHALAFAAGLDQLNGLKSQAEVARELGCSRALVSHYVVGFSDLLQLHITKFRKSESSRPTYSEVQLKRNN